MIVTILMLDSNASKATKNVVSTDMTVLVNFVREHWDSFVKQRAEAGERGSLGTGKFFFAMNAAMNAAMHASRSPGNSVKLVSSFFWFGISEAKVMQAAPHGYKLRRFGRASWPPCLF